MTPRIGPCEDCGDSRPLTRGYCGKCYQRRHRNGEFGNFNNESLPVAGFAFNPQPWAENALCSETDPESFFPDKGGSTREAKAVCGRCTVAAECLIYALDNHERYGIWGGMSERERHALTRQHSNTQHDLQEPA